MHWWPFDPRENHSEIERRRRNKMTAYITELSEMVPTCSALARKPDKLTILRMAVSHMKTLKGSGNTGTDGTYKPSFLTDQVSVLCTHTRAHTHVRNEISVNPDSVLTSPCLLAPVCRSWSTWYWRQQTVSSLWCRARAGVWYTSPTRSCQCWIRRSPIGSAHLCTISSTPKIRTNWENSCPPLRTTTAVRDLSLSLSVCLLVSRPVSMCLFLLALLYFLSLLIWFRPHAGSKDGHGEEGGKPVVRENDHGGATLVYLQDEVRRQWHAY